MVANLPLRLIASLGAAMTMTVLIFFTAPLLIGNKTTSLKDIISPVEILPITLPNEHKKKQKVIPKKVLQLPKKVQQTKSKPQKIKKIDITLNPLQVELPNLKAANLPVNMPTPQKVISTGFSNSIFDLAAVDTAPKLKRYIPPQYPAKAKGRNISGKVMVRCVVTAGGRVKDVKIISADPAGYFEKSALKAVKKWTFIPAKLKGEKVPVYVDIPLSFKQ